MSSKKTLIALAVAGLMAACGGGGSEGATSVSPPSNTAPAANTGTLQNVVTGTVVTLNGSNSSDANGDALTYAWTLTSRPAGSTAVLSNPTSAMPTFVADVAGAYVASLVVNDGTVNSTASTVTLNATVANAAPVANAGTAQNVTTASTVTLNGSNSSDANGDTLTYAWTLTSRPAGSSAVLSNPTSAMPTFFADIVGIYVWSLRVNDGTIDSAISNVTINAVDRCAGSLGNEANFSYEWSLQTQKVTLTNNNLCDPIVVRATSAPIFSGSPNGVVDIRRTLAPGETLIADAALPASPTWKPSVIYTLPNGKTYVFKPLQAGQSSEQTFELVLLLSTDTLVGTLSQFSEMFSVGAAEVRYGDCQNFNWLDRRNGTYQILPNSTGVSGECYVGNIQGVTSSGDGVFLPPLRYFVTER